MVATKKKNARSISEWEMAHEGKDGIVFEEMRISRGKVCLVIGCIKANGRSYKARWREDGRCYYNGVHLKEYDIF